MVVITVASLMTEHLAASLYELAASATASTVKVRAGRGAMGSGVLWKSDGSVVTNAHVAFRPRLSVELSDGSSMEGEVVDRDLRRDLALIRTSAVSPPAASVGRPSRLLPGELVMSVGNPLGASNALAFGVIHAVARHRPDQPHVIRADLRLAPGYSGGPMLDSRGQVIGINTMVSGGLALAVGADEVTSFLARTARPRLGVGLQAVHTGLQSGNVAGLLITEVVPESAAADAGILLGDILLTIDSVDVSSIDRLLRQLEIAGEEIRVDLLRGGSRLSLAVRLRQHRSSAASRQAA